MHMPTRDPRDQGHSTPAQVNHTMGKGSSPDNAEFERRAEALGVDAVLLGHIKGQWQYRGRGGIPYYIDGGAGGDLYTNGPVGVDHGYWHGFRLMRVDGTRQSTDVVPIFVPGGIRVPDRGPMRRGQVRRFEAFGRQPIFINEQKVDALELRDPDPIPREGVTFGAALASLWPGGAAAPGDRRAGVRRRRAAAASSAAPARRGRRGDRRPVRHARCRLGGPRRDPRRHRSREPAQPARVWTSANESVLAPVPSSTEDPRRNPRKQTQDGAFRARCPGNTRIIVQSGVESRDRPVQGAQPPRPHPALGPAAAHALPARSPPRRGRSPSAPARRRRGAHTPRPPGPAHAAPGLLHGGERLVFRWDGRLPNSRGRLVAARRSRYRVEVKVHSDRRVDEPQRHRPKGGPLMQDLDRRQFVGGLAAVGGGLILGGVPVDPALAQRTRRRRTPFARGGGFSLGVAAGAPYSRTGTVVWTRLDGFRRDRLLRLEVARDPGFRNVVHRRVVRAKASADHTVETRLLGRFMRPGREYYYRFYTDDEHSPVGRFRTLPPPDSRDPVRVGFFSCQDYQAGYYNAHAAMAKEDLDLVVCLGDYTYERTFYEGPPDRRDTLGANGDGEVQTLPEYRAKYRLYRRDRNLQAMHAAHPFVAIWDDHEIEDNWAGASPGEATGQARVPFINRRNNGFRAFFEYMPFSPVRRRPASATSSIAGSTSEPTPSCSCSTSAPTATTSPAATSSSCPVPTPRVSRGASSATPSWPGSSAAWRTRTPPGS